MIALLVRYWYLAVIAGLLALVGVQQVRVDRAKLALSDFKSEQAVLTQKAEADARKREQALEAKAGRIEEEKNEELRIVSDQLDSALASLSKRPERTADNVPKNPESCKGATGADLSRSDAEFLTRESARADRLRSALDACYKQYDSLTQAPG